MSELRPYRAVGNDGTVLYVVAPTLSRALFQADAYFRARDTVAQTIDPARARSRTDSIEELHAEAVVIDRQEDA